MQTRGGKRDTCFKSLAPQNKDTISLKNVTNALQMSFMSAVTRVSGELHGKCCTAANETIMGQIKLCKMMAAKRRVNIINGHNPYDEA